MLFKIITIPFSTDKECFLEESLDDFILSKKINNWQAQFFIVDNKAYWTVFFEYEAVVESRQSFEMMSEVERLLYQRLREWRKSKAEKEGVPVFIVATNKELKEVVKKTPKSIESLKQIHGFGKKKIEKHGKELIHLIQAFYQPK